MIRINLLPIREARRHADIRKQGILLGVAACAALLLCVPFHLYEIGKRSARKGEISKAQQELKALDKVLARVDQYTVEKEEIERTLRVIQTLESSRSGPVRILDQIATRIPKRMWITQLEMHDGELRLEGLSLDAEIVATFLTRLEESPLLSRVELEATDLIESDGLKLNSFKLRSHYPFGLPEQSETASRSDRSSRGRVGS